MLSIKNFIFLNICGLILAVALSYCLCIFPIKNKTDRIKLKFSL